MREAPWQERKGENANFFCNPAPKFKKLRAGGDLNYDQILCAVHVRKLKPRCDIRMTYTGS